MTFSSHYNKVHLVPELDEMFRGHKIPRELVYMCRINSGWTPRRHDRPTESILLLPFWLRRGSKKRTGKESGSILFLPLFYSDGNDERKYRDFNDCKKKYR